MTLRQEMLAAAGRAPMLLSESRRAVADFLRSQQNPDGGFRGRGEASDLYYTVFAIEGLVALGEPPQPGPIRRYLASFGDGAGLDFVHLACLARCWADLDCRLPIADCRLPPEHPTPNTEHLTPEARHTLLSRIEAHRSADGGYSPTPGAEHGTAYGCFLALGALEDLSLPQVCNLREVTSCLAALRRADGGYANERCLNSSTTPATAAAVTVAKHLTGTSDRAAVDFLLARAALEGGFFATEAAPFPDLLSTATALHALAGLARHSRDFVGACVRFVGGLRADSGGYRGVWLDDAADAEYTFYALLALGHLGEHGER